MAVMGVERPKRPVQHPPVRAGLTTSGVRYDVEADWSLMTTCNFRCTYCFLSPEDLGRKIAPPADVEHLAGFFDATDLTWLLHLTGGEPFLYPRFVDLCRLLTRRHYISINTNADSDRVRVFAESIDPARVDSINCGAHVQQREERGRVARFIRNVRALVDADFDAYVSCVMYPPIFSGFPDTWERYAAEGIYLIPKAVNGRFFGALYPDAYTDEEIAVFREYSERAEEAYRAQIERRVVRPSIDPFLDRERFLGGLHDHWGTLCHAGRQFVRIREDGTIQRCGPHDVIGNIVDGWFERRAGPSPCQEIECPYFCEKYLVRSSRDVVRWRTDW